MNQNPYNTPGAHPHMTDNGGMPFVGQSAAWGQGHVSRPADGGGYAGYGAYSSGYGAGSGYGSGWPPGMAMQPSANQSSWFGLTNDRFIKGALIGAAAAYLLTNESVQRTLIKGGMRAWQVVAGGIEEVKERFHDAKAELHTQSNDQS